MTYKDLVVWKVGKQIAEEIYAHTLKFSWQEYDALGKQMRRAAVSIPSNIAEGKSRGSRKDYARFVSIAIGSAAELETQLQLAISTGVIRYDIDRLLRITGKEIGMLINLRMGLLHPKVAEVAPDQDEPSLTLSNPL